ncbi:hypothetical protein D5S19_13960 [Amycolatopsis panacis]|uniref:Uncharacterized protein n=1 Tax=Amycolatopsis panacis TaxID=2340917 RepID=A0A419I4Q7_9PSEU|nr:hypothetical protein D5S19_13960 [Amycolatopsis panacis]
MREAELSEVAPNRYLGQITGSIVDACLIMVAAVDLLPRGAAAGMADRGLALERAESAYHEPIAGLTEE